MVKAYDESLKLAKEEVAKRIARSTNTNRTNESGDDDESTSKQSQTQYKIGDYVRATYEDGLDYEAKIISIDWDKENCVVQFVGYGNEETIVLNDLVPSWGKKARKTQLRTAVKYLRGAIDTKRSVSGNRSAKSGMHSINFNNLRNSSVPIPPPPPMPPMLTDTTEDSENMSAMLMSWYMSGYYTGYYQGQKQAQNKMAKK